MRHYVNCHTAEELRDWSMDKYILECILLDQPLSKEWIYQQFDVGQSEDDFIDTLRAYAIPIDQRYFASRPGDYRDAMIEYGHALV